MGRELTNQERIDNLRHSFELVYAHGLDLEKYLDMECVLLELPTGTYKNKETQKLWKRLCEKSDNVDSSKMFNVRR